jgi:hypothetical protein
VGCSSSIACTACLRWFHVDCAKVAGIHTFHLLPAHQVDLEEAAQQEDFVWHCPACL